MAGRFTDRQTGTPGCSLLAYARAHGHRHTDRVALASGTFRHERTLSCRARPGAHLTGEAWSVSSDPFRRCNSQTEEAPSAGWAGRAEACHRGKRSHCHVAVSVVKSVVGGRCVSRDHCAHPFHGSPGKKCQKLKLKENQLPSILSCSRTSTKPVKLSKTTWRHHCPPPEPRMPLAESV